MEKGKYTLRAAETALLLALGITLLVGMTARGEQRRLADKLVRLHVLAVSDSEEDQAVKLRVRDEVLAYLTPILRGAENAQEAVGLLSRELPALETIAREVSGETFVSAALSREPYPTREYETFSLPAGMYTSLRITLGAGEGHNWWCVVYPPLCTASAGDFARTASALEEDEVKLITEDGKGYEIRFRLVEWWGRLTAKWK